MKTRVILAVLTAGLMAPATFATPVPQEHGQAQHARPEYHFKPENRSALRSHYPHIDRVRPENRGHFVAGGVLPGNWRHAIRPVPQVVIAELPPIPAGYVAGYIDGYAVIYDPNTGYILDVIDIY